ncbi:MAG: hypothetical protein JWP02_729 [Acidimicrobiales bacterium]|nr:hypothetical protein [Acidimicrobiales bacterium]
MLVTAVACGSSGGQAKKADEPTTTTPGNPVPAAKLQLTSSAFTDGGAIPRQFTCDGASQSPPLAWSGIPAGAASLALRVQDIDTPQKFVHWLVYDIKPTTTSLAAAESPPGAKQAPNSFNKPAYGGLCPPQGAGRHRYVFTVLALETEVTVSSDTNPSELWSTLERSSVLARGVLTGTYQRGS